MKATLITKDFMLIPCTLYWGLALLFITEQKKEGDHQ